MEPFKKKDTFKISKGEGVVVMNLEKTDPFKSGTNTYDGVEKAWHGYNIISSGTEYTYFASDAVHNLFLAAKPEPGVDFTLELRPERNQAGDIRSTWYLNGMNIWKYQDQEAISTVMKSAVVSPSLDPTPDPGVATEEEVKEAVDFDKKNKIVADIITQVEINLSNASDLLKKLKDETVVPF